MSDVKTLGSDFRVLLYLFIALRVILLIVYQPEWIAEAQIERGLTTFGDFYEHYQLAADNRPDNLPYRDYWVEFPPVWTGLTLLAYALVEPRGDFSAWASLLAAFFIAVDAANLTLIWKIGGRLYGRESGISLAWIYALLAAPLIMFAWNFEVLVLACFLGGWWCFATKRPRLSGALLALGILTKYLPLLALPMIWRAADRKTAAQITALALGLPALILIPLLVWGGKMAQVSLTVQFNKPSYQTVWALIDGNYGTGSFPGGAARYHTDPATIQAGRNAAVIPAWLRILPFAALGLWHISLPPKPTLDHQLAFLTLTLILFMLWAQGWSPQWIILLLPLILLNFPSRIGVLIALVLMIGAFMEYPLLFRNAADSGNLISGADRLPFAFSILTRTAILSGMALFLIQKLRET